MKVSEIMQKSVIKVNLDDPLKDVARIIFSLGISGVPVVNKKLLVGIVTEEDILKKVNPSLDGIEKKINDFLNTSIGKVMNPTPHVILESDSLLKAQELMLQHNFSKLPVVNIKKELTGIISQEDIFKEIFKNEMPQIEEEKYAGYIAKNYDLMVDWDKRFAYELPALFNEFRKHKVESVVDLGVWTGEYTINLAAEGVKKILGLDHNPSMVEISQNKIKKLTTLEARNVKFELSNFNDFDKKIHGIYDAAICMGNSLPYIPVSAPVLFKNISTKLKLHGATIILQVLNFEKVLKKNGRLLSFVVQESNLPSQKEHMFLEFFDKTDDPNKLIHNVVVFESDGKNWVFSGVTSVPVFNYSKNDLEKALQAAGFKDIKFAGNDGEYQGGYGQLSFTEPFDPIKSDWLNIVANRK